MPILGAFLVAFAAPPLLAQQVDDHNPVGITGAFSGSIETGCAYGVLDHSSHREITDIVVPGSLGKYPLKMTRYYNSRAQYYALSAIGLGPGWAHEYSWLLRADGRTVVSPHGDVYDFFCDQPVGASEGWDDGIQGQHANGGTWRLADGGKVVFNDNTGQHPYQVTAIIDPYGLRTTIAYDKNTGLRTTVTEPGGRYVAFFYNDTDQDTTRLLTRVEAHGLGNATVTDWVNYSYSEVDPGGGAQRKKMLATVTYSDNTTASYTYRTDNALQNPPLGSWKYTPLLESCSDKRYSGPMREIFYEYQADGPHGAISKERYGTSGTGPAVSSISPGLPPSTYGTFQMPVQFVEERGDDPSRTFTYSSLRYIRNDNQGPCPDVVTEDGPPRQQVLLSYTDFLGHSTQLFYDPVTWYITSVEDANHHTTYYERGDPPSQGGIGEIKKITYQDGTHIDYTYQNETPSLSGHYLYTVKEYTPADQLRSQTIHYRDANTHKIYQSDYKDGNGTLLARETFTYCDQADSQCGSVNPATGQMHGQIKTHLLKNGAYVHYRYDSQGRGLLIDKWEPTWNSTALETDPKTHYTYYPDGDTSKNPWTDRVKTMTLPANVTGYVASETYEYDKNGVTPVAGRGLVTKSAHADGKYKSFGYDAYGNKLWEKNELRNRTSYMYDSYNRVLTVEDPIGQATGHTTTYTYTPTNGGGGSSYLHTTNSPDTVTTPAGIMTTNVYDENFRKTQSTVDGKTTWFHYDGVGNQDWVTDPRGSSTPSAAWTTYTDYDNRNRKSQVREPFGHTTQFYYDDGFNITRIIRGVGTPELATETKAYDGMNRLKTDTVPKSVGVNIVTQFQYYAWNVHSASLLWKITDGENHWTTFEYDPSGLKTKMTYHDGSLQQWAYDDAHNLKNRTTVHGEVQNFGYDIRNRKIGEWWDGWPADGEWRAFGYDDASRLTLATNGTGTYWTNFIADVRRFYDDAGRLTLDRQTVYVNGVGNMRDVNYPSHDDDGRLLRMYVAGISPAYDYTFSYDDMGRFEKILITGNPNVQFQYSYDPASNETQRYNWANHIAQNYVPDSLNRMTSVEVKNTTTNTQLGLETYDYYPISRLRSVKREDNKQDSFTYYLDGELNVATYGANPTPPPTPSPTPTPPGGQVGTPTFAPGGGLYCAYSLSVTISTTTSNAQMRYTTDGTTPTSGANGHGTLINGSRGTITVSGIDVLGVNLQAIAYESGMTDSAVRSDWYYHDCGQGPMTYPLDMAGIQSGQQPMAPDVSTVTYTLDKAGNRTSVNGTSYSPNSINQYTSVGGNAVTNGNDHGIQVYGGFTYYYMRDQELTKVTAPGFTYDLGYDALRRA